MWFNSHFFSLTAKAKFELHIKFTLFYFELLKRFFTRHFRLNNKIFSSLLAYYNNTFTEKPDFDSGYYKPILDVKSMKNLVETVQEFYLVLGMVFKQLLDRLTEIIAMGHIENLNTSQFSKLRAVFDEVLNFFVSDIKLESNLNSWIVTDKEGVKKSLFNLVSTLSDKFSLLQIQHLKTEYERSKIPDLNQWYLKLFL